MAESSGRIAGEMRWHIYRSPQKPNTIMVLGSILTKPDDLESSLNYSSGIEPFPGRQRLAQPDVVHLVASAKLSKEVGGRLKSVLPVSPLVSAGGGAEASQSGSAEGIVEALDVRAEIVMPDAAKDYMDRALLSPRILEYVREGLFARPLYLIVGVATCRKVVSGDTIVREKKGSLEADIGVTGSGVEAGIGVFGSKTASTGSQMEIQEECDFAYRVREFQYSRLRKRIKKSRDVLEGAMFEKDGQRGSVPLTNSEEEDLFEEVPVFEYLESDDEDFDGTSG